MSKNHFNSKRKDLAFITFESHEKAVSAIQKFEEEKKNPKMENYLKKIFYLGENESVNLTFKEYTNYLKDSVSLTDSNFVLLIERCYTKDNCIYKRYKKFYEDQ